MLQYGKPINKNSKSTDLKIKFGCLGCGDGAAFGAAFCVFVGRWAWYSLPKRKQEAVF
jgi:hypothetical protein